MNKSEKLANAIGNRLEILMRKRGYSQTLMAYKTDISQAAINRYINGKRIPAGDCIIKLAEILNCSTDDILMGLKTVPIMGKPYLYFLEVIL